MCRSEATLLLVANFIFLGVVTSVVVIRCGRRIGRAHEMPRRPNTDMWLLSIHRRASLASVGTSIVHITSPTLPPGIGGSVRVFSRIRRTQRAGHLGAGEAVAVRRGGVKRCSFNHDLRVYLLYSTLTGSCECV